MAMVVSLLVSLMAIRRGITLITAIILPGMIDITRITTDHTIQAGIVATADDIITVATEMTGTVIAVMGVVMLAMNAQTGETGVVMRQMAMKN